MKKVFLTAALLAAFSCQAADIEVGAGITTFGPAHNGTWYQEGYPYDLRLTSPSFKLGITDTMGRWRWHAGAEWLGRYGSSAVAVASDYAYFNNRPYPVSHWYGEGKVYGLYLTAGPQVRVAGLTVHPHLGVYAYRPSWQMTIPDWVPCAVGADGPGCFPGTPRPFGVTAKRETLLTPLIGVSVGRGNWSLDLNVRTARGGEMLTITTGPTWNVGFSWRF